MAIPKAVKIKGGALPAGPGVYFFRGRRRKLLYIGKATSLRSRVNSHFVRPHDARIARMTAEAESIEYTETPTAVEALMLESRLIRKHQPPYNIVSKDDKSGVYLALTREDFPRPVLVREHEMVRTPKRQFLKVLGPFRSAGSVEAALRAVRPAFPWSACRPPKPGARPRPCFDRHLGRCPGVCAGEVPSAEYRKVIAGLIDFLEGRRERVASAMEREMHAAARAERFEEAAAIRDRLANLAGIRDLAVMRDGPGSEERPSRRGIIDIYGRIEGYDVSHLSGRETVGSMVVFADGRPRKSEYRKFRIRDVAGPDDTKAMAEMLRRRFARLPGAAGKGKGEVWPRPDLILVDGGIGQVNAAKRVMAELGLAIPLVGLAKGPDRKREDLVFGQKDHELQRLAVAFRPLLVKVRDEAHRFAVGFHRQRRRSGFLKPQPFGL